MDMLSITSAQTNLTSSTAGNSKDCVVDFESFPDFSTRLSRMDPELVAIFSREQYKARTLKATERVNRSKLDRKKHDLKEEIKKQESMSLRLKSAITHLMTENIRLQRLANAKKE